MVDAKVILVSCIKLQLTHASCRISLVANTSPALSEEVGERRKPRGTARQTLR